LLEYYNQKLKERTGNVLENKGVLWKTGPEARMSLKKIDLALLSWKPVETKGGYGQKGIPRHLRHLRVGAIGRRER
jgi:hypothetical protein